MKTTATTTTKSTRLNTTVTVTRQADVDPVRHVTSVADVSLVHHDASVVGILVRHDAFVVADAGAGMGTVNDTSCTCYPTR